VSELDALKLLRRIEAGVAGKTGEAFFRQIVCEVARALGAHSAFTSWLLPSRRARMLAFWSGGAHQECLEYSLEGTPCEFVYRGDITSYARNIGDVFPVDRAWFEQLGVHSYLGIPVKEETGLVCGHLAVMDTCERDWAEADLDVLRLFSLRAAAEINRTRYQRALEDANTSLREANEQLSAEIARRAAVEAELAAAKVAAESANHAKSVFISQMSHELRTPLNGILGFTQLLRRNGGVAGPKVNDSLNIIERSGEHLLKLVNELLDLARIEAGKLELSTESVDLPELLQHIVNLIRVRAVNAGLSLVVSYDADSFVPVLTDERAIRQILLNILGNAMKFTERGGTVTLRVEGKRVDDKQHVRFVVADSGIGIDDSELARIFEPFHRVHSADRPVEGTGLGLAITQRLVTALNGVLTVSSEKGLGTTFTVECALEVAPATRPALSPTSQITGFTGPPRTILVADDDQDNRALVSSLLESVGFAVHTVADGRDALRCLEVTRPDLILTDLLMPSINGLNLVRTVRSDPTLDAIPVIAMSASASDINSEEALQAGCACFLPKPLKLAELLEAVGQQLGLEWRHRPGSESIARQLPDTDAPSCVDPDLAAQLRELALRGDILAITALIDSVTHSQPSPVFAHLRELAERYDLRGIRRMLEH